MTNTVLITGCSSGYGRETALHFLDNGWNVVATMRRPAPLASAHVLPLDVTDRGTIDAAVRDALRRFGQIDAVVNNAGIGLLSAFEVTPESTIREIFETNVFGVMAVARAVIPHFRERRSGTLINVTSSAAIVPYPLVAAYTASKFAIEGFTESLAYELATFNVAAKLVEPGYGPNTAFTANGMARMQGLLPAPYAAYGAQLMAQPPAKTTEASDVARAVYAAASDGTTRLRYPAGPDAEELAALRRACPGDDYVARARALMAPATPSAASSA